MRLDALGLTVALLASASGTAAATDASLAAALQQTVDQVARANPELPSINATVLSPAHGLAWTGVAGKDRFGGTPVTGPLPFRIASSTKPFVAATVLRLVEQGKLRLADPITAMISDQTAAQLRQGGHDPDRILLRHLLEHTAGLPDHAQMEAYVCRILKDPKHRWTRAEQIALAMETKPLAAPGVSFSYSDTGYVILGEIVERASGMPLAQAVRTNTRLDALGLKSTWWEALEPAPRGVPARAHQYLGTVDVTDWDPGMDLHGGGGLVSTTPDLAVWYRSVLTGGVFGDPRTLAMALATPFVTVVGPVRAPHAPLMGVMPFGRHMCWGHGGFWGTMVLYCPDIDTAVALSVNMNGAAQKKGIAELLDGLAATLEAAGVR
jgi:D-alanyl-D-alanine carboxypeptidase